MHRVILLIKRLSATHEESFILTGRLFLLKTPRATENEIYYGLMASDQTAFLATG